jgi:dihydroorotate dehydrogenase
VTTPFFYSALRRALFRVDPETSHEWAVAALRNASATALSRVGLRAAFAHRDDSLAQDVFGIRFPNPVGLAAGFDKNGVLIHGMAALGFGFVEIGTVTPRPQAGNPKPRMFRLAAERSLQNALGFNNDGMERIRERIRRNAPYPIPVGINLGKNKDTPGDRAADDYAAVLETMAELGDYFVVNLSSPNTPGLRALQNVDFVRAVFERLIAITPKPILLKLSPDESPEALAALATAAIDAGARGIVATNTTIDYSVSPNAQDSGGISGQLLREKSRRALAVLVAALGPGVPIVSAGGIDSGEEALARLRGGARLVQLYTGLVYEGPGIAGRINEHLTRQLRDLQVVSLDRLGRGELEE